MAPLQEFGQKEQEKFDRLEEELRGGLAEAERKELREKCLELQRMQNVTEDASCLPSLRISDIPALLPSTLLQHCSLASTPVQVANQPTNEVSYFRALLDTSSVPQDHRPLLPIFTSVLTKLGAAHLDFRALDTAAGDHCIFSPRIIVFASLQSCGLAGWAPRCTCRSPLTRWTRSCRVCC